MKMIWPSARILFCFFVCTLSVAASAQEKVSSQEQETLPTKGSSLPQESGETSMPTMGMGSMGSSGMGSSGSGSVGYGSMDRAPARPTRSTPQGPLVPENPRAATCPFRPQNADIQALWNQTIGTLQNMKSRNSSCQAAVQQMLAAIPNPTQDASFFTDPLRDEKLALDAASDRIAALARIPAEKRAESAMGDEMDTLIAQRQMLYDRLERRRQSEENRRREAAVQQAVSGLGGALRSIPTIEQNCTGDDAGFGSIAARAGVGLVGAASPLLFGPGQAVGAVASLISDAISAFSGPSRAERGLSQMEASQSLISLSCLYYETQRIQCRNATELQPGVTVADLGLLTGIRRQFEQQRNSLGAKMRSLLETAYPAKDRLAPIEEPLVQNYCALMSYVPGNSARCSRTGIAETDAAFSGCRYIDYFESSRQTGGSAFSGGVPRNQPSNGLSSRKAAQ